MDFRLLGPLDVAVDGRSLSLGRPRQQAVLVALLLNANTVVPAEHLVDSVWDLPPESVRANLRTYVSSLRRMLEAAGPARHRLQTHPRGYLLAVEPGELDLVSFDDLLARAELARSNGDAASAADRLREALRLWRGVPFGRAVASEALRVEAERLEERRLGAIEQSVSARLAIGEHRQLVAELRGLVATHPLRERLWCQFMLALYRCGRQADALAAYADVRRRLAGELGIEPGPELAQLERQILRAAPELEADGPAGGGVVELTRSGEGGGVRPETGPPRQLPAGSATFTGREGELARLVGLLSEPSRTGAMRVVALHGPGGVGKSALAVRAGHEVAELFPDGQLYVDARGSAPESEPLEVIDVLGRFLRSLGVDPSAVSADTTEAAARFRSLCAGRRLLVLVDNADSAERVRPLLPGGSGCAVLVTSRRGLTGLDGAQHVGVGTLRPDEAFGLVERFAGSERVAAEADATRRLAGLCGYLPLALRIVGARLATRPEWSVRDLTERLAAEHTRLDELRVDDLDVRACFEVSYRELTRSGNPDGRSACAFRLVGVLPVGELTLPVAAELLDLPEAEAERALERAVDTQLMESPAPGRYRMHDLLHLFAAEQAREQEPEQVRLAALRRVLRWYLGTVRRVVRWNHPLSRTRIRDDAAGAGGVDFDTPQAALAWLESEHENLRVLIVRAAERSPELGYLCRLLAEASFWFLFPRGRMHDLDIINQAALRSARRYEDPLGEVYAAYNLAAVPHLSGDHAGALRLLELALARCQELGDRHAEQTVRSGLGITYAELERHEEARACLEEKVAICRQLGDRHSLASALTNLGEAHRRAGRWGPALDCSRIATELAQELDDRRGHAAAMANTGLTHLDRGRAAAAIPFVHSAIRTLRPFEEWVQEWKLLLRLSEAYRAVGRIGGALESCDRALELSERVNDARGQGTVMEERGKVLLATGDAEHARQCWQRAWERFHEVDTRAAARIRRLVAGIQRCTSLLCG